MFRSPMPLLFNFFVFSFAASHLMLLSFSAVLAPVTQDKSSRFFTLSVYVKNPPQPTTLLLDISAPLSWVADCSNNYSSSTYHFVPCSSPLCTALRSHVCSNCSMPSDAVRCPRSSCIIFLEYSKSRKSITAVAMTDSFAFPATDGRNLGHLTVFPYFVFSCSEKSASKRVGLKGVGGLAALGRSNYSLAAQVSSSVSGLPRVFALCLSGSPSAPGVAFFGTGGPYYFLPQVDLSTLLVYTPLLLKPNPGGPSRRSAEYFIGLTSITVNGKSVLLNRTVQPMNQDGLVVAKLSTLTPYTMLHSSIYKAFIEVFVEESAVLNLSVTKSVQPFDLCYNAADVAETNVGADVPVVDFVMHNTNIPWSILGSNSMVRIFQEGLDAWCLGFLNGGPKLRPWIVIGGHQMVDNLLQFDLENNRLGFTSSVLVHNTMCANFNFTPNSTLL